MDSSARHRRSRLVLSDGLWLVGGGETSAGRVGQVNRSRRCGRTTFEKSRDALPADFKLALRLFRVVTAAAAIVERQEAGGGVGVPQRRLRVKSL